MNPLRTYQDIPEAWRTANAQRYTAAFRWHEQLGCSIVEADQATQIDMLDLYDKEVGVVVVPPVEAKTDAPRLKPPKTVARLGHFKQPIQSDRNERWDSIVDAAKQFKLSPHTLYSAVHKQRCCLNAGGRMFWRVGDKPPVNVSVARGVVCEDGTCYASIGKAAKTTKPGGLWARMRTAIRKQRPFDDGKLYALADSPLGQEFLKRLERQVA